MIRPMTHRAHCSGERIAKQLQDKYGLLIGGNDLVRALGFPNPAAFREARRKNRLNVRVFAIPDRRGSFALTQDVAAWIERMSTQTDEGKPK
jgi:hypothetical protein